MELRNAPVRYRDYALMVWQAVIEAHSLKRERMIEVQGKDFHGVTSTLGDFLLGIGA